MNRRYLRNFDTTQLCCLETPCLIVGAGVAGLWTALKLARSGCRVMLMVKGDVLDSNSHHAQGGIAAAVGADDFPELHHQDTLTAGAGLCSKTAAQLVTDQGPEVIAALAAAGVSFDTNQYGWQLGQEGGHRRRRIMHVDGDATGAGIVRVLWQRVQEEPYIQVCTQCMALDLLVTDGRCCGVLAQAGPRGELLTVASAVTILATGGAGQLYRYTTNPAGATGDGVAMSYRAGVCLQDLEFMQFHPTALAVPGLPSFLISEAVRGEGAPLLDGQGNRFMLQEHVLGELAPRDVVARAIYRYRQKKQDVVLDTTQVNGFAVRFPGIYAACRRLGVDPCQNPLPVAPAAHYWMGGIRIDLQGKTSLPGLYACGEAACSGLHGANRLASNSLLEGIVFGERVAAAAAREARHSIVKAAISYRQERPVLANPLAWREQIRACMERHAGVEREKRSLLAGMEWFASNVVTLEAAEPLTVEGAETCNLFTLGRLVMQTALWRQESRGCHYRSDFMEKDASGKHLVVQRRRKGGILCKNYS